MPEWLFCAICAFLLMIAAAAILYIVDLLADAIVYELEKNKRIKQKAVYKTEWFKRGV